MTAETTLSALLKTLCARVYPDVAPDGTTAPYITWQALGGESLRYGDNTAPDKRNTLMQVSVWSLTRAEALSIIHQAEESICASSAWQAEPQGEAASTYEPDTKLYGSIQRFLIFASR